MRRDGGQNEKNQRRTEAVSCHCHHLHQEETAGKEQGKEIGRRPEKHQDDKNAGNRCAVEG